MALCRDPHNLRCTRAVLSDGMTCDTCWNTVILVRDVNEPGYGFVARDGGEYGAASLNEAADLARSMGYHPQLERRV